jgi:hypothetical protein
MQMPGEARVEEPETAAESYPIIIRSYEPAADLDDRLQRIYTVLSLWGKETRAGCRVAASAEPARAEASWRPRGGVAELDASGALRVA